MYFMCTVVRLQKTWGNVLYYDVSGKRYRNLWLNRQIRSADNSYHHYGHYFFKLSKLKQERERQKKTISGLNHVILSDP